MRILALVTDAYGGYGGIAQYNRDLLRALSQSQQVESVTVLPRIAERIDGPVPHKVQQLAPSRGRAAYAARALRLAQRRYDLVFCGHLYQAPLAAALGAPVWLQAHGIEAWEAPSRWVRRAVRGAALTTAVSRYTRRRLLQWAPLAPERVRVLPNTIRPEFTPGPARPDKLATWGLAGATVLLTVARLSRADAYKGHHLVIAAMPRIRQHIPDAVYVLVGDGDRRAELEALAARLGVEDAVRFLGRLDDADTLSLYRSADLFVMPSKGEGFGIAFVEAAAAGLPVVGDESAGSPDALADGAIGRPLDLTSAESVADAVLATLAAPPPCAAPAAQRFAFENFADHVDLLLRRHAR